MLGISGYERELKFHPTRRWRFDFAFTRHRFAIEVEGLQGRHQTIGGFIKDLEKYSAAAELGWVVYRCSGKQIESGKALDVILKWINDGEHQIN